MLGQQGQCELHAVVNTAAHCNGVNTILTIDTVPSHPNEGIKSANIANVVDSNYASLHACQTACPTHIVVANDLPNDCLNTQAHASAVAKPDEFPSVLNALLETHGNTALEAAKYCVANLPKLTPARHTVASGDVLRHCDRSLPVTLKHLNKRSKPSKLGNNPKEPTNPQPMVAEGMDTHSSVESFDSGPSPSSGNKGSLKERLQEILGQHAADRTKLWSKKRPRTVEKGTPSPPMGTQKGNIDLPNELQTSCALNSTTIRKDTCCNAS